MSYSLEAIFFIILQGISILLLLYLIFSILKSKSYFTKWTLFQLYVSTLGNELTNITPILIYGNNLLDRAKDTPLCLILQRISSYFLYPLEFFSLALTFYLWYALVMQRLDIEKKCFWYVSVIIWIYTTIYNGILLKEVDNDDILVNHLTCNKIGKKNVTEYIITTIILAFCTVLMSCHSTVLLWKYWLNLSNHMSRRNAIKLGEAERLCAWCFTYLILLLLLLVPRAIQHDSNKSIIQVCNFGSTLAGALLFLVFGTQKKAAVFLPCSYYVPPGTPQFHQDTVPNEITDGNNNNNDNLSELTQMPDAHLRQK